MDRKKNLKKRLASLIPKIKRARGYRLYDYQGNRYLDLFQCGGNAVLGHRAFKLNPVLKNVISKGLVFNLPSIYEYRLKKAISNLFPAFDSVIIVSTLYSGLKAISGYLKKKVNLKDIEDPVITNRIGKIVYWRPFIQMNWDKAEILIPVIPFSMAGSPFIICFKKAFSWTDPYINNISAVLLAGAARSVYDLKKYTTAEWYKEDLLAGCKSWIQKGIYIKHKMNYQTYKDAFIKFMDHGILLSPIENNPSILPAEASLGEFKKMIGLFKQIPGEYS